MSALALAGCTDVDDTLGGEFIPDDQRFLTRIATLGDDASEWGYTRSFQLFEDSLPAARQGWIALGNDLFAPLGTTSASALVQFVPSTYDTISAIGFDPIADSASLRLYVLDHSAAGREVGEQEFSVYEVTDLSFMADSTLFFNAPLAMYASSRELFRFTLDPSATGAVTRRLTASPDGMAWLDELLNTDVRYPDASDQDMDRERDSLFTNAFKGLYITPSSAEAKGIYRIGLSYNLYAQLGGLNVYLRNHDPANPSAILDTATAFYPLVDEPGLSYSMSATSIARDYPATLYINRPDHPVDMSWIEGLGGLHTQLELTDVLFARLDDLREGQAMALSSAVIYLPVEGGDDAAVLDESFERLGMYRRYALLADPIPDYNPTWESTYGALPYGGYLERSGGYYKMDITATLQQMLLDPALPRTIRITPDRSLLYDFTHTPLRSRGVMIKLIYSLVP